MQSNHWLWRSSRLHSYVQVNDSDSEKDGNIVRKNGQRTLTVPLSWALSGLFALFAIVIFVTIYLLRAGSVSNTQREYQVLKSPIPKFPSEIRHFHRGEIYFNRSSEATDAAWKALAGPGDTHQGFVTIDNWQEYGLNEGAETENVDKRIYGVSMFHQLHCLGAIRKMMWDLANGNVNPADLLGLTPTDTSKNFQGQGHGFWHVQHCFDYLRQALQCAGDTALEWPVEAEGKKLFVGWETPHMCKSYDAAWVYVSKNSDLKI